MVLFEKEYYLLKIVSYSSIDYEGCKISQESCGIVQTFFRLQSLIIFELGIMKNRSVMLFLVGP